MKKGINIFKHFHNSLNSKIFNIIKLSIISNIISTLFSFTNNKYIIYALVDKNKERELNINNIFQSQYILFFIIFIILLFIIFNKKKSTNIPIDDKEKDLDQNIITVEAKVDNLPIVTDFIEKKLEEIDCPIKVLSQINVAVDELFSNIARYAYYPGTGDATIKLEIKDNPKAIIITFIDEGKPYNPLEKDDPDVTLNAEDREIGGLGIFLVKKTMNDMNYEYKDGKNILKIRKDI